MLKSKARGIMFIVLAASLLLAAPALAGDEAEDPPGPSSVSTLRRQIESLKRQSDDQRKQFEAQMEQQRKLIEALQQRLDQIQG